MMKMDITKRRKMMALFLAGTLTVSAAVTGCGRKNVDYNVDNTQPKQRQIWDRRRHLHPEKIWIVEVCGVSIRFHLPVIRRLRLEIPAYQRSM